MVPRPARAYGVKSTCSAGWTTTHTQSNLHVVPVHGAPSRGAKPATHTVKLHMCMRYACTTSLCPGPYLANMYVVSQFTATHYELRIADTVFCVANCDAIPVKLVPDISCFPLHIIPSSFCENLSYGQVRRHLCLFIW